MEWNWWWREIHNGKWEELKEAASSLASLSSLSACCCPSLSLRRWHEFSRPGTPRRWLHKSGVAFARMFHIRVTAVVQHEQTLQQYRRPLSPIKMFSSAADAVGGGGYDCFPALAAPGIERAAGEGPSERRGREREERLVQLLDGWMDGTEGGRGVYTTSAPTVPAGSGSVGTEREIYSNHVS